MTTPETSWSEILINAGMEPELAKAFDLIELRTPDARAVKDLTIALLSVRSDVEGLKSELESAVERLTKLEEAESALVHLLGEQIVELRKLQSQINSRFDGLNVKLDALNGVVGGNRKAIDRLDASLEVLHAKVRGVDSKLQEVDEQVRGVDSKLQEVDERVQRVADTQREQGESIDELRGEVTEILAWVRTQRDSE